MTTWILDYLLEQTVDMDLKYGIALSEGEQDARAKALAYSESVLGMVDHQCEGWPPPYLATGPFGLKITRDSEPIKGTTVSYTIEGWSDRPTTAIWMDGRPHPSKYAPHLRAGFTTGKWEGNTLVVTSTGFMDTSWLDEYGSPHSDEMRIEERYQRVDKDHLQLTMTVYDSKAYTAPWVGDRKMFVKAARSQNNDVGEDMCVWSRTGIKPNNK